VSNSVHPDEEDDIKEAERRTTVKLGPYVLPPLSINTRQTSKRNSGEKRTRTGKRDSKRELKRTSERRASPGEVEAIRYPRYLHDIKHLGVATIADLP
jgi:hypothetical protein